MAEIKALTLILNCLGVPLTVYTLLFVNLDIFQKTVVWILVVAYLGARFYFFIVFSKQKRRRNEIEMEMMRKELKA